VKKEGEEEEKDPRDDKISKVVHIDPRLHSVKPLGVSAEVEVAVKEAEAVKEARTLCNTRATICDPEYFAKRVADKVEGNSKATYKQIKGQGLKDLGMNLFYEVGKSA